MNEIVDARNLGTVCRLCLSTKEPKCSVFADQAFATISLSTKIQTFLSIEILASDGISTLICSDCLRRINEWHTYKEHCLRSQQKLKQYKGEGTNNQVEHIKVELEDGHQSVSEIDAVSLSSDDENTVERCGELTQCTTGLTGNDSMIRAAAIKREPTDETALEMDSIRTAELLLNPMAVSTHKEGRHTAMTSMKDAAIIQASRQGMKRKIRRGPQTHYRGSRRYKQRCSYCQIYLHSKYSYGKHMERFHSGSSKGSRSIGATKSGLTKPDIAKIGEINGIIEMDETAVEMNTETIEDVEEELMSLEKDAPLTPVQQSIISQLKTFSCYACRVSFTDRRSTLNHIRQHMPDLRPYTCIACLTEFADRSVYKLHCGASFQCAMKIALVVPEHGTEKYFTCNMCLRSMADRRELLSHLSKHSDRQYERLIGGPSSRSPPRLEPASPFLAAMTSSRGRDTRIINATDKKGKLVIKRLGRRLPAPYKNGDPTHNHVCIYCGMIYRYKQNMYKHVSLCKKLPPESRLCYRCVKCGMTFLAFNKFQTHVNQIHGRKKDLVCHRCDAILTPGDFLSHMREHSSGEIRDLVSPKAGIAKREHESPVRTYTHVNNRSTHLSSSPRALAVGKTIRHPRHSVASAMTNTTTITYSCKICRCSFGDASILTAHMADHENGAVSTSGVRCGIQFSIKSDPGSSNGVECYKCGKVFASHQNLRRHERNVHDEPVGRFNCFTCAKTFVHEHQWTEHVEKEHRRVAARVASCPQCPRVFESKQELIHHRNNVHGSNGEDNLACYICGKLFASETSLKIHRGHHFRVNSRLSVGNGRETLGAAETDVGTLLVTSLDSKGWKRQSPGSPRARKSLPNRSTHVPTSERDSLLQCQVCDDHFNDVSNLRKHLWDVHCARSKPEKPFVTRKLRCDICAIILPDEESRESHLRWHESDSISRVTEKRESMVPCNLCGKHYSSLGNLRKHQKRHRVLGSIVNRVPVALPRKKWLPESDEDGFACNVCHKTFAKRATMKNHKASAHPTVECRRRDNRSRSDNEFVRANVVHAASINDAFNGDATGSVIRDLSRKTGAEKRIPRQQRRLSISTPATALSSKAEGRDTSPAVESRVPCTLCSKLFRTITNMRQHFTKMHATRERAARYRCTVNGCGFTFQTLIAQRNHEKSHANVVYSCALCPQRMLNSTAMAEHVLAAHRTNRVSGHDRMTLCTKIDLNDYVVEGANGRQCPACGITYPNNKALKVHYLKVHENAV